MRKKRVFRRSGFEDKVEANLKQRGIKYEYETIRLGYTKRTCPHCGLPAELGRYTPDFIFQRVNGIRLVVECKGYLDSTNRTLMQRVKRDNPTEDIRFLFQRDNPIRRGSATKYTQWSIKNGFPCCVGTEIPKEWLE